MDNSHAATALATGHSINVKDTVTLNEQFVDGTLVDGSKMISGHWFHKAFIAEHVYKSPKGNIVISMSGGCVAIVTTKEKVDAHDTVGLPAAIAWLLSNE